MYFTNQIWLDRKIIGVALVLLFLGVIGAGNPPSARAQEGVTSEESSAVCPSSIDFGETIQCSILSAAETDSYTFTASAGDKALVRMSRSAGNIWPEIQVYDSEGTRICEAYSTDAAEISSCYLLDDGTYTILAYDHFKTGTGDYYLYLQRLNNPGNTVPIAFGQTLFGTIPTPAETDTYTFTASAGDKVLVRMSNSAGTIWPEIRVYNPEGTKLCEAYSTDAAEISSCTLPADGTYFILAYDHFRGETGDYYLYLQRLNNPGNTVPIAFGQTLFGTIPTPAETDTYTFTASAGDKVLVRMSNSAGTIWPEIRVYDPAGAKLCEAYSTDAAEISSCTLPADGTYSILAYDHFRGETGDYYLYLQRLNNPGNTVPIAFGQTLFGTIPTPAETDTYTFTASAGDKVLVRMSKSAGTIWPEIRIYNPEGVKICEAYSTSTAEIASCTLPSNGTYAILAYDHFKGETGDYYLYLRRLNIPPGASIKFLSNGAQDGWILESSETSNTGGTKNYTASTLNLGDDAAKKQYRSILSFNTGGLPDNAVITKVTLKVKRQGVTGGGNPVSIFKGFMVDVKKGTFGTSALQLGDFKAAANKTIGPFSPALSSGWYSINMTTGKAQINKTGLTQIRLRFKLDDNNNNIANILKLYSGNAGSSNRPQLIIEYYIP